MTTSTITRPDRPPDPDYDELWDLTEKLNQLLGVLVAGGASIEEALIGAGADETEVRARRFNAREVAILTMVAADADEVPAPT